MLRVSGQSKEQQRALQEEGKFETLFRRSSQDRAQRLASHGTPLPGLLRPACSPGMLVVNGAGGGALSLSNEVTLAGAATCVPCWAAGWVLARGCAGQPAGHLAGQGSLCRPASVHQPLTPRGPAGWLCSAGGRRDLCAEHKGVAAALAPALRGVRQALCQGPAGLGRPVGALVPPRVSLAGGGCIWEGSAGGQVHARKPSRVEQGARQHARGAAVPGARPPAKQPQRGAIRPPEREC